MVTESVATFGDLLRQYRRTAGFTQEDLAERAGLSVTGIQKIERGVTHPYRDTAQRLLQALQLGPDEQARFRAAIQRVRRTVVAHQPALGSEPRNNLPLPLSSLIGRESELIEVAARLSTTRLLTLTGVGGCGKTRLAVELALSVSARYSDGAWLVELGPLTDPELVPHRVAAAVGLRETAETPLITSVIQALRSRRLLLLLDNCEHLLDACAQLSDELLRSCPELQVLATSREPLGVGGEITWRVPSLALPNARVPDTLEALDTNPCVRLFVERARAVQPRFTLGPRNAAAVVQICRRLDGIPLALELAAARVDTLTPDQLAARLDQRFHLLTGGVRTALPRQQTLIATLDWSYDLLSKAERRMFERLAVFSGGWTLEAAEAICAGPGVSQEDILDLLARLTRKSIVSAEEAANGAERYALLESVREYARQKLAARGSSETTALRERHAAFFASLAEQLDPQITSARSPEAASTGWDDLQRADVEYDNMRSMLGWWLESGRPAAGLTAGVLLETFWTDRGWYGEGIYWLEAFLELAARIADDAITPRMHARAMYSAGMFATHQGNYALSRERYEACTAIWRELDDALWLANALSFLGLTAWLIGDPKQARELLDESLQMFEAIGNHDYIAAALRNLGMVARSQGDYTGAADFFRASVGQTGKVVAPAAYSVARGLCHLGRTAFLQGQREHAMRHFHEGLLVAREALIAGHTLADCLDWVAAAEGDAGYSVEAARLFGAADAQWRASGAVRYAPERAAYAEELSRVRQQLDSNTFAMVWAEGDAMSAVAAVDYALQLTCA